MLVWTAIIIATSYGLFFVKPLSFPVDRPAYPEEIQTPVAASWLTVAVSPARFRSKAVGMPDAGSGLAVSRLLSLE
ncbi:MAG: hypothetical protein AAGH90_12885 [Pseudomonadota bacterium]